VTVSVVVCDDVPGMRRLARIVLEEDGDLEVVGEAADGRTAIQEIQRLQPDVVVLDLSMPEMDGLEALPVIHEVAPRSRIVVFSGFDDEKLADAALSRSASRYVRKGAPLHELRQAVRSVALDGG
jgi:DNA-binding NarL/FixJ family response regulator